MDPTHQSRSEDGIIAYTWDTFIRSNGIDPDILLYLPMTKVNKIRFDIIGEYESLSIMKKRQPYALWMQPKIFFVRREIQCPRILWLLADQK